MRQSGICKNADLRNDEAVVQIGDKGRVCRENRGPGRIGVGTSHILGVFEEPGYAVIGPDHIPNTGYLVDVIVKVVGARINRVGINGERIGHLDLNPFAGNGADSALDECGLGSGVCASLIIVGRIGIPTRGVECRVEWIRER